MVPFGTNGTLCGFQNRQEYVQGHDFCSASTVMFVSMN